MAGKFQVAGEIRQLLYFCWQYSRLRHVLLAAAGLIGRDGRAANRALPGFPGGTDARGGVRSLFLGLPGEVDFPTAALYLVCTASDHGSGVALARRRELATGIAGAAVDALLGRGLAGLGLRRRRRHPWV
jgi:hypothetical protein